VHGNAHSLLQASEASIVKGKKIRKNLFKLAIRFILGKEEMRLTEFSFGAVSVYSTKPAPFQRWYGGSHKTQSTDHDKLV